MNRPSRSAVCIGYRAPKVGEGWLVQRFGVHVPIDEVYVAAGSIDIEAQRRALKLSTNPVDRHRLLSALVESLYRIRKRDPEARSELVAVARLHLNELQELLPELRRHEELNALSMSLPVREWRPGLIMSFERLEMALCELGDEAGARQVWREAVRVGYISEQHASWRDEAIAKRMRRLAKAASAAPAAERF